MTSTYAFGSPGGLLLAPSLEADLVTLLERQNRGGRHTLIVPSEYLQAVITTA